MISINVNFDLLEPEYSDPESLNYKKIRFVNSNIPEGGNYLDIGMGTVELISLIFDKHEKIFGVESSVNICKKRFNQNPDIILVKSDIDNLKNRFIDKFDCITCLDVLKQKIKILFGKLPTHHHSHSSYCRKLFIETAGFTIIDAQSVEFPIIHSDFLRRHFHLLGKCCINVTQKKNIGWIL